MHDSARAANLLGAAALAVADGVLREATKASDVSASGSAALVTLLVAPGLSVTELGRRIGLSQPAAARMMDSLRQARLVRRSSAGRSVALRLTEDGERAARRVLAARQAMLSDLLGELPGHQQEALAEALVPLLGVLYRRVRSADRLCRLCDRAVCCGNQAVCPVGAAERAAGGV